MFTPLASSRTGMSFFFIIFLARSTRYRRIRSMFIRACQSAVAGPIVTGLGKAELHRILVRGYDLTEEIVGKITFSQMTFLMLTGRMPTAGQTRMIDALLTILVEHGMVASVIAARLTYHTAPEAIQGAVAAAILGAGSVHL